MPKAIRGFHSLIGIDYEKLNCWDLAEVFYERVFEIEVKHYFDEAPEDKSEIKSLIFSNIGDFTKVDSPEFGDLILINVHGIESHIAIYVGDGMFLHTTKGTGSCLDRIERWVKTISGYYRLEISK